MGGHAKCLLLMTRGEGGGSKIPKTCLRNTWMFPKADLRAIKILFLLLIAAKKYFWALNQIFPNKDARNLIDRHPPTDTSIPASLK